MSRELGPSKASNDGHGSWGTPGNPDPWAGFQPAQTMSGSTAAALTRAVQGPVEERLTAQDMKIQGLEQQMAAMLAMQEAHKGEIQKIQAEQGAVENRLSAQLVQAVTGVKNELANSFAEAMAQQTKSFDQNLRDIKQMLNNTKRKSSPSPPRMGT